MVQESIFTIVHPGDIHNQLGLRLTNLLREQPGCSFEIREWLMHLSKTFPSPTTDPHQTANKRKSSMYNCATFCVCVCVRKKHSWVLWNQGGSWNSLSLKVDFYPELKVNHCHSGRFTECSVQASTFTGTLGVSYLKDHTHACSAQGITRYPFPTQARCRYS